MASQFGVAYSASVAGVAVIAGGPYGCSRSSLSVATTLCSCPTEDVLRFGCVVFDPSVFLTYSEDETASNAREIDDIGNLKRQRIWLQSGSADGVVAAPLVNAVGLYYKHYGVPSGQVGGVEVAGAGHGFVTPSATQPCGATKSPYLNKCANIDTAANLLTWLYPDLKGMSPGVANPSSLTQFDQSGYLPPDVLCGMDSTAWLYVPKACGSAPAHCRLHVVFHGCLQAQSSLDAAGRKYGTTFVVKSGYLRWAEAGNLVLLFPQVQPSSSIGTSYGYNPQGCWDFWGYTDPNADLHAGSPFFARQSAPQMKAVKAMIDDLLMPP